MKQWQIFCTRNLYSKVTLRNLKLTTKYFLAEAFFFEKSLWEWKKIVCNTRGKTEVSLIYRNPYRKGIKGDFLGYLVALMCFTTLAISYDNLTCDDMIDPDIACSHLMSDVVSDTKYDRNEGRYNCQNQKCPCGLLIVWNNKGTKHLIRIFLNYKWVCFFFSLLDLGTFAPSAQHFLYCSGPEKQKCYLSKDSVKP